MKWAKCNLVLSSPFFLLEFGLSQRIHDLNVCVRKSGICQLASRSKLSRSVLRASHFRLQRGIHIPCTAYLAYICSMSDVQHARFLCQISLCVLPGCVLPPFLPWRLLALKKHINKLNIRAAQELRKSQEKKGCSRDLALMSVFSSFLKQVCADAGAVGGNLLDVYWGNIPIHIYSIYFFRGQVK